MPELQSSSGPTADADEWLTLEQASRHLGVHASTLRRWANGGAVGVFTTPGGHRRFRRADLDRLERKGRQSRREAASEQEWVERAVSVARGSLTTQRWVSRYDEVERQAKRDMGRRLTGLILRYVSSVGRDETLLAEARAIGHQHALDGLQHGQSLIELLQAMSFFRVAVLEVAMLRRHRAAPEQAEADARLLRRIEELLGEVQTGIVEPYASALSPAE